MLRRALVFSLIVLGALCASPARADPLLMFLFGMAREMMYDAYLSSQKPRAQHFEPLPEVYPGTTVEPRKLRELIDESFIYLSDRRREEIFQSLHEEIIKPENSAVRAAMIAYFAERAVAVRMVMERLSNLPEAEMQSLAAQFAAHARALPVAEREQLRAVLSEGLLPVPPDLNRKLVVAIAEIPRPSVAEDSAQGGVGPEKKPGAAPPLAARTKRDDEAALPSAPIRPAAAAPAQR